MRILVIYSLFFIASVWKWLHWKHIYWMNWQTSNNTTSPLIGAPGSLFDSQEEAIIFMFMEFVLISLSSFIIGYEFIFGHLFKWWTDEDDDDDLKNIPPRVSWHENEVKDPYTHLICDILLVGGVSNIHSVRILYLCMYIYDYGFFYPLWNRGCP